MKLQRSRSLALSIRHWSSDSIKMTWKQSFEENSTFLAKQRTMSFPKLIDAILVKYSLKISPFSASRQGSSGQLRCCASLNDSEATLPMCFPAALSPIWLRSTSLFLAKDWLRVRQRNCLRSMSSLSVSSRSGSLALRMVLSFSTGARGSFLFLLLALVTVWPGCFSRTWKQRAGQDWQNFWLLAGQNSQASSSLPSSCASFIVVRFLLQDDSSFRMGFPFLQLEDSPSSLIFFQQVIITSNHGAYQA